MMKKAETAVGKKETVMLIAVLIRILVITFIIWLVYRLVSPYFRRPRLPGVSVANKCQKCDGYGGWQGSRGWEECTRCRSSGINAWRE